MAGRRARRSLLEELTPREREVLALLAEELGNQAIADRLVLTRRAVESYRTCVPKKR